MGISTFPNANGGTSAANWTVIGTATPSAVTSVSFTGISGYKRLKVVGWVSNSTTQYLYAQFNSDTTNYQSQSAGYSLYMSNSIIGVGTTGGIYLSPGQVTSGGFDMEINNANSTSTYKDVDTNFSGTSSIASITGQGWGVFKSASAVTSIAIISIAAMTGNIYLMGQN
jgi:hypothetical protein